MNYEKTALSPPSPPAPAEASDPSPAASRDLYRRSEACGAAQTATWQAS